MSHESNGPRRATVILAPNIRTWLAPSGAYVELSPAPEHVMQDEEGLWGLSQRQMTVEVVDRA